jgi:hypothetical protein
LGFGTIARVRSIASGFWPDRRRTNLGRARDLEPHRGATLALRSGSCERTLGRSSSWSVSCRVAVLRLHMQSPSSSSSKPLGHLFAMQRPSFSIWRCPHSRGQMRSDLALIALSSSFVGSAGKMVSRAIVCILRSTFAMETAICWRELSGDDQ